MGNAAPRHRRSLAKCEMKSEWKCRPPSCYCLCTPRRVSFPLDEKRVDALLAFFFFFFFNRSFSSSYIFLLFALSVLSYSSFVDLFFLRRSDLLATANVYVNLYFYKHDYIVGWQHQLRAVTGSVLVADS